jgi:hypothetical protein
MNRQAESGATDNERFPVCDRRDVPLESRPDRRARCEEMPIFMEVARKGSGSIVLNASAAIAITMSAGPRRPQANATSCQIINA